MDVCLALALICVGCAMYACIDWGVRWFLNKVPGGQRGRVHQFVGNRAGGDMIIEGVHSPGDLVMTFEDNTVVSSGRNITFTNGVLYVDGVARHTFPTPTHKVRIGHDSITVDGEGLRL